MHVAILTDRNRHFLDSDKSSQFVFYVRPYEIQLNYLERYLSFRVHCTMYFKLFVILFGVLASVLKFALRYFGGFGCQFAS